MANPDSRPIFTLENSPANNLKKKKNPRKYYIITSLVEGGRISKVSLTYCPLIAFLLMYVGIISSPIITLIVPFMNIY